MKRDQKLHQSLLSENESQPSNQALMRKEKMLSKRKTIGGSNFFESLMFTWCNPLLSYGAKHKLEVEMMPTLPDKYSTSAQFNRFHNIWQNMQRSKSEGWTLIRALLKLHKKEWLLLFLAIFVTVTLFMSFPLLTALNIDYLQNHRDDLKRGIILFLMTFFISVIHRIVFSHYFFQFMNLGIRLSNVVTMIIYNKSLKYSPVANKQFTEAEIINYSQVDAQRLIYVGDQIAAFFYGPLQIIVGLIIMYFSLGLTFLTAIGSILLILFLSYFVTKISVQLNEKSLKAKDERMKATEEMLDIIRYIKIAAIQKFIFRKVDEKRDKEIRLMLKKGLNFVIMACLFWFTNPLILTAAFFTFIFLGNDISSEVAFTTMTVVGLFEYPMYSLPNAISEVVQIITSLKRIQKFLFVEEIKGDHVIYTNQKLKDCIEISNGNFYWKREEKKDANQEEEKEKDKDKGKEKEKQKEKKKEKEKNGPKKEVNQLQKEVMNTDQGLIEDSDCQDADLQCFKEKDQQGKPLFIHALRDINTKIKSESFTMIVGDIGSGKTSLLLAILNEMLVGKGSKITISGNIAYSPQKPWIMSKTLKENITFASEYDQRKFNKVVHYASLEADLKMLPKGVQTQIGQKGINISGGQKARVSLARALYSEKDILLLDDILSAVDVHVGQFIVKQTVREFLKGKTIVMPTHAIKFASYADEIIVLKKGRIVRKGAYEDISNTPQFLQVSQKQHKQEDEKKDEDEEQKLEAEMAMVKDVIRLQSKKTESEEKKVVEQNLQIIEELMIPEDKETGNVSWAVLKQFIKLSGGWFKFVFIVGFSMLLHITAKTIASILIQIWCQNPSDNDYELYIFIGLHVSAIFFLFVTAMIVIYSGTRQSTNVHKEMIKHLLYASLGNFYNRVPTGRIVNRLTKDLRELDQSIMYTFLFFFITLFQLLQTLAICAYTTSPLTLIPIVLIAYLANLLRRYYLKTQMEVSRYEKSTNSPVVSGILSTISGLSTIRAYRKEGQFSQWQYEHFDTNKRVRLTKSGLENWFANTLAFLCFFINMPCIAYCMFSAQSDSSIIGLLMTYALYLIFNVANLVLTEADFETKLVSIERIYKFMEIQPEKSYVQYCKNWSPEEERTDKIIKQGNITFKKLKVRYRMDLPDVIKGMDCEIKAGEKIGIVGRTGAGKTTIVNTLLGVTQISGGKIQVDGLSIEDLPLKALRESVTMIDQDPTLIKSSFRENLDITNHYTDEELQAILRECNLWEVIEEKGGLDSAVSNSSLSAGEKQLLCICRAFLKHSRVVLIDEATANIDVKNDALIQRVIAEKFKQSTVLTIAHRLSTLENSDKIMVMEQGRLVEFGSPSDLEARQGVYSEMMRKNQKQMLK